jgi:hypothetical protein
MQDVLEEDVARVGCRNWRINVQSRQEWRKLVEEVKCHPGRKKKKKKKMMMIWNT